VSLVEDFEGRIIADAFLAAHQGFVAENRAGAGLDDRLEGILDDEFGKGDDLIAGAAAEDLRHNGGSQGHPSLHVAGLHCG
jgi:hypothetical protein